MRIFVTESKVNVVVCRLEGHQEQTNADGSKNKVLGAGAGSSKGNNTSDEFTVRSLDIPILILASFATLVLLIIHVAPR